MNLFEQMIDYIRAQQMYTYLNCILNNKFDKFTFLTNDHIVTKGFINKEWEPRQMNNTFKAEMFKSFIIGDKPNANDDMKTYYKDFTNANEHFKTENKTVINYDEFVEELNQDEH